MVQVPPELQVLAVMPVDPWTHEDPWHIAPAASFLGHEPPFAAQNPEVPQASVWAVQFDAQQIFRDVPSSRQAPLTHSVPFTQVRPLLFFWQMPLTQLLPPPAGGARALQSVFVAVQVVLQASGVAPTLHWNAPQLTAAGVVHVPAPLQVLAGITASDSDMVTPPTLPETAGAQTAAPQTSPALASWQLPLPSHRVVLPQTFPGVAAQVVVLRGVPPAFTGLQVPSFPVKVQLWQAPAQALLQHTPSLLQTPVLQSLVALQALPGGRAFPQRLVVLRHVRPPVQLESVVHVVRHDGLVALHMNGLHIEGEAAAQVPRPSQLAARVSVLPLQLAWRQPVAVDQGRQAPAPLQVPSLAQFPLAGLVAMQRPRGSPPPETTGEQVPTLPETLQLRHRPAPPAASVHAESQQTPSVQKLEAHWLPAVHPAPGGFRPHELLEPQVLAPAQSVACDATVHDDLQEVWLVRSHWKVPHDLFDGVTQAPLPSQLEAGVTDEVPDGQLAALQFCPLGQNAHAPPLHIPVVPQVGDLLAAHMFCGSGLPSGTAVQMPGDPVRLHAMQAPLHAVLQQTPWAQIPERHSFPAPQSAPPGARPHLPLTQPLGGWHWVNSFFSVQEFAHRVPLHWYGLQVREEGVTHWPEALHFAAGV
jgi:hypothetical protein